MKKTILTLTAILTLGSAVAKENSIQLAKPATTTLESLNLITIKANSCSTACSVAFSECRKYEPLSVCLPMLSRCLGFCP